MIGMILGALLLAVVLGLLCAPLLRAAAAPGGRARYDGAVYRDQLAELEREVASGQIDLAAAEPARLEIARRLLAATAAPEPEAPSSPLPASPLPGLALAVALAVGVGAVGLYLFLGAPGLPDAPLLAAPAVPGR